MKTAKATVSTFDVKCPHCTAGFLYNTDGSFVFSVFEANPRTGKCSDCDEVSKIPNHCAGGNIPVVQMKTEGQKE